MTYDVVTISTHWGDKVTLRTLSPMMTEDVNGIIVEYHGAETGLAHRVDMVMENYRARSTLEDNNIASLAEMDLKRGEARGFQGPYFTGDVVHEGEGGGVMYMFIELAEGSSVHVKLTSQNISFYLFGEDELSTMFEGGYLRYEQGWKNITDETLECEIGMAST